MYEQVETGPLYERAVQLMTQYRRTAARMGNTRGRRLGQLDRQLERIGENLGEALSELTDQERTAISCWRPSIVPDTYEVDYEALTARPYVSIRTIERVEEEYDVVELKKMKRRGRGDHGDHGDQERLKAFISKLHERL